jgi:hypothetical protein
MPSPILISLIPAARFTAILNLPSDVKTYSDWKKGYGYAFFPEITKGGVGAIDSSPATRPCQWPEARARVDGLVS